MPGMASRAQKGMAILGLVIAPVVIHIAMATQRGMAIAGILVVVESVVVAWIALRFLPIAPLRWAGCAAVLVLTASLWRTARDGIVVSSAIPHAIAYLSVLAIFATSLAPGRKAIVTVLAERSRGTLSPAVERYTRRVTVAWCLFCAGQLLGSLLLALFAPPAVWSIFVNVFNLPLIAVMFGSEFAYRQWRHGTWPRERLTAGFRTSGQAKTTASHDAV